MTGQTNEQTDKKIKTLYIYIDLCKVLMQGKLIAVADTLRTN